MTKETELFEFNWTVTPSTSQITVPVNGRQRLFLSVKNQGSVPLSSFVLTRQGHPKAGHVAVASTATHYTNPAPPLTQCCNEAGTATNPTTLAAGEEVHLTFNFQDRATRLLRIEATVLSGQTVLAVRGFFPADL